MTRGLWMYYGSLNPRRPPKFFLVPRNIMNTQKRFRRTDLRDDPGDYTWLGLSEVTHDFVGIKTRPACARGQEG